MSLKGTLRDLFMWLVAIALFGIASVGHADGWYGGLGIGSSKMKDASTALIGTTFEDSDSGLKLFVGSQFNPNAAFEFSYVDFGKFTGMVGSVTTDSWEATAFNVSLVGIAPLGGSSSIFGKIGFAFWNVDDVFLGISASNSGSGVSYGLGFQYDLSKQFGLRAEWEQFADVGDQNTTGQSDLGLLTLSAIFRF